MMCCYLPWPHGSEETRGASICIVEAKNKFATCKLLVSFISTHHMHCTSNQAYCHVTEGRVREHLVVGFPRVLGESASTTIRAPPALAACLIERDLQRLRRCASMGSSEAGGQKQEWMRLSAEMPRERCRCTSDRHRHRERQTRAPSACDCRIDERKVSIS